MISHPSRHCAVELQALPSRIGQVRRIVSAQLRYWHLDSLIERASLGVTELLTNVHRHAGVDKTCTVRLELLLDRLTVSVHDHDPRLPVLGDADRLADSLATCGRGLAMIAALSESWGARPDGGTGKVVWFTLPTADEVHDGRREPEPTPALADVGPSGSEPVPHTEPHPDARPRPLPEPALLEAAVTSPAPARSAVPG
ncbi:ATP-binding protein [Streptomyces sp. NPDC005012]|uniref:ATP-binding protein n=1 Tax=unclassified Streptomyces TaxID=2593676 RepID=UPI0033B4B6D0